MSGRPLTRPRLDWVPILARAVEIVESYDTGVSLRQLHYRLVSEGLIPNTRSAYNTLSSATAAGRRDGTFPDLIDLGRDIQRAPAWDDAEGMAEAVIESFRLDRQREMDMSIYLGVEKRALVAQLDAWFGDLGLPILALAGYASQSFVDQVRRDVVCQERPAVLLYGGDFDATGEDIDRDFVERVGAFDEVIRVALTAQQVESFRLPRMVGFDTDPRAAGFVARHGELVQVELDALDPVDLRALFQVAIDEHMDMSRYQAVVDQEEAERQRLINALAHLDNEEPEQ